MLPLRAEAARLTLDVQGNLLQALVEDTHHTRIPAHPYRPRQVFRRHRVISLVHLDVSVAMDAALTLMEERETLRRQRPQGRPFHVREQLAYLLPRRAMHARVRHGTLPVAQEAILLVQAGEGPSLEGVVLHIVDATFHLALVPWRVRPRRQQHHAVVLAERLHLRIELGVEPVRPRYRGTQVVAHQPLRHAAKGAKGILQTADQGLRRLAIDRFAVTLARMAQHHAQHMRPTALASRVHDRGALAEVDLRLFPRQALQAAEWQRRRAPQTLHEAAHAVVAACKAVLADQVLMDALRAESQVELGLDHRLPDSADAHRAGPRRHCYHPDL